MKCHFFAIPALHGGEQEAALNRLLAAGRIGNLEKQFVSEGASSFWAICVTTIEDGQSLDRKGADAKNIDYKNVLSAAEFALYARLRERRKELAERDGVPVYQVFTNEQLASMIQGRLRTHDGLAALRGVGRARLDAYGAAMLALLDEAIPGLDEPAPDRAS